MRKPESIRRFSDTPAVRSRVPVLLGIVGASGSGKTFSALRLAAGIQRVVGGEVFGIDTESGRMLHYADRFKFRHVPFEPPHGPLDYLDCINHCVQQGAKTIVIDSMTHEHSGTGGVMDQIDDFMAARNHDEKYKWTAQIKPKGERKRLNNAIVQLGINAIFCYRAVDKTKPGAGGKPDHVGWVPETTSNLHYEMLQRFLLTPSCDGFPSFLPTEEAEKRLVKNPIQFREWFQGKQQLSEDIGERFAKWAAGDGSLAKPAPVGMAAILEAIAEADSPAALKLIWDTSVKPQWKSFGKDDQAKITDAWRDRGVSVLASPGRPSSPKPAENPDAEPDEVPYGSGDPDMDRIPN